MASWLASLDSLAQKRGGDDAKILGGKAARLVWLKRNGFDIPQTWVLLPTALVAVIKELSSGTDPRALIKTAATKRGAIRIAEAREEILQAPLPAGLSRELEEIHKSAASSARWGFAVRSSIVCEDQSLVAMAALGNSVLGVMSVDTLTDAVRAVWASLASLKGLSYLAANGVRDLGIAVVIQRMVEAETSGVMFTKASIVGESLGKDRLISANFGAGPTASAGSSFDSFRIDARGRLLDAVVTKKIDATIVKDGALSTMQVARPDDASLGRERLTDLAEIATRLERLEAGAWEVEFAIDCERLWIVQATTNGGEGFPAGGDASTIWSNVNIGEALPGVATPLTWSVAGEVSDAGFRKAFAALGCSVPRDATLVGNIYGRFFLNLSEFMRALGQIPKLDPRTLVDLAGGYGGDELAQQVQHVSKRGFYVRFPFTVARLVREQLRLDADVAKFEEYALEAQRLHNALDLAILPDAGLARKIHDLNALLEQAGTMLFTCASNVLAMHVALKTLLARIAPLGAERLAQTLTSAVADLESARPAIGVMRVAALARGEPEALAILKRETTRGLDALPDGPTRRGLQNFLELYGERAVRDAELSTPRWKEDPSEVLAMLRAALRGEALDSDESLSKAHARAEAESEKILPRLGLIEQTLMGQLVTRAQRAERLRERMRTWVTRVLGMMREAFLDADRRLLRLVPELEDDMRRLSANAPSSVTPCVFFLTEDEIRDALQSSRSDLAPLVRARRAEFARDCARATPPSIFMGRPTAAVISEAGDMLRGVPASGGIVEGKARVMRSADAMSELEPGEILVVHTIDVGWTPLFFVAAGIVTELGGPLSHAAVVAREFAVPTIVNVSSATRSIRTGDRLRIDGDRGVIEKLRG